MGDTDFWEWLERANANERIRQSIKLVNQTAGIKVNSSRQLRRFTVLVEHITNLISRLSTATCTNWVSQKITQRTEGAKQLITVILAQNDPVVASLLAIAILGTLWEAAD